MSITVEWIECITALLVFLKGTNWSFRWHLLHIFVSHQNASIDRWRTRLVGVDVTYYKHVLYVCSLFVCVYLRFGICRFNKNLKSYLMSAADCYWNSPKKRTILKSPSFTVIKIRKHNLSAAAVWLWPMSAFLKNRAAWHHVATVSSRPILLRNLMICKCEFKSHGVCPTIMF